MNVNRNFVNMHGTYSFLMQLSCGGGGGGVWVGGGWGVGVVVSNLTI